MKITAITGASNPLLKRVRSLHQKSGREKSGLFLLEGPKLVAEALDKKLFVEDIIVSTSYLASGFNSDRQSHLSNWEEIKVVEDKLFNELITTTTPCGVIAVARMLQYSIDDCLRGDHTLLVVAEAVQDPGNLGAMIRTSLAFGATGLIATSGSVDPYNPKVVRAAMGALFVLPVIAGIETHKLMDKLKSKELRTVALEPTAETRIWDAQLQRPLAVIFGNEGNGLTSQVNQFADELVTIPMNDESESLNVAMTASIVLYECARHHLAD